MIPRRLSVRELARKDIERRARYLAQQRGMDYATAWTRDIYAWLEKIAASGAVMGSAHPQRKRLRTFSYHGRATILAEFSQNRLWIARVYFPGQDWAR